MRILVPCCRPLAGLAYLLLQAAVGAAAPPTLTYLFPAGAQRGATVEVTAGGTFERWPVRAWVSGTGVRVEAASAKGKLSVRVAPDAVPGTYWVRLYDDVGATSLRPFVVGTLPEVLEQEPNDDPKKPHVLTANAVTVNGRLHPAGDVDVFAVKLARGQTLVASLEANHCLGSPMDAILQVLSADGFVLEENNDYHGLDPQIVFTAPAAGAYRVRTFAFPATPDSAIRFAGGETYVYRLTLTTGGFVDHPFPLAVARSKPGPVAMIGWNIPEAAKRLMVGSPAHSDTVTLWSPSLANTAAVRLEPHPTVVVNPGNDPQHPQAIALPVTVSGRLDPGGAGHAWQFPAKKGQKLFFQLESQALGYPLEAALRLTDEAGKTLAQAEAPGPRPDGKRDPELSVTVPRDGSYRLEVRDLHGEGGFRHVYRLRALFAEADYGLTLAADRFVLTPGKPLEVPVSVARRNGLDQEIEITAEGLPPGVRVEPVRSAGGGGGKPVMLRLTATEGPAVGSFRIVGRTQGLRGIARTAQMPLAGLNASTSDLWLTVVKPSPATPTGPTTSPGRRR